MEKGIISYLSKHISLTDVEVSAINDLNLIRKFSKGTLLLKEGETSEVCYLVLEGCVRSYFLIDGEEKTTEFYTENQPMTPVSYIQQQPSEYYLSCVGKSVV